MELKDEYNEEWTPPLLTGYTLEGYQKLGLTFLHKTTAEYGFALIGDYMGIGKVTTRNYRADMIRPCRPLPFCGNHVRPASTMYWRKTNECNVCLFGNAPQVLSRG